MPGQIVLKITQGILEQQSFLYNERITCVIGRALDSNIKLPDDKYHETISRYHCLLDINPPNIRIRDFGSRNGTYVNGNKIGQRDKGQSIDDAQKTSFPEVDLKHLDEFKIGQTVFQVNIEGDIPEETIAATEFEAGATPELPADLSRLDEQIKQFPELESIRNYTPIKELGRGGMGAVYLAKDESSGALVALKIMLPQVAVSEEARQMFLRETKNTELLRHPNLVELYQSGCHDDTFFFTMEYCNRGSLQDLIKQQGGKLTVDEVVPLTIQALDGLQYAHSAATQEYEKSDGSIVQAQGLVHRDLKPANIYLTEKDGELIAKVGDFGLAKAFDTAGLSGQTATGSVGGSPLFMPRQQILNFKYAKPNVDVWAMAATLYKALTGTYPRDFPRGEDPWLTALKTAPIPIRNRDANIPAKLAEVIDTALVDDPDLHFASAREFRDALEEAYNA